jgi:flagellar motor protein MotB
MRRPARDIIEFPANPFVALADFLMVLLLVLIMAIVHQIITNSRHMERLAVDEQSKTLRGLAERNPALRAAMNRGAFRQSYYDGDLQRFRIQGSLSFDKDSDALKPEGRRLLQEFGRVLAQQQGNPFNPITRPFKRVIVNGNADWSEGESDDPKLAERKVWELSVRRAEAAVIAIREGAKPLLHPSLIEASGRGSYDPAMLLDSRNPDPAVVAENNRRLEVIVVYSGEQTRKFMENGAAAALIPTPPPRLGEGPGVGAR